MNLFTKREVTVLDRNVLKEGSFITFCYMQKEEYGEIVKEGRPMNGIINYVSDDRLSIMLLGGDTRSFSLNQLSDPDAPTYNAVMKIKILGIKENAIE